MRRKIFRTERRFKGAMPFDEDKKNRRTVRRPFGRSLFVLGLSAAVKHDGAGTAREAHIVLRAALGFNSQIKAVVATLNIDIDIVAGR